MNLDELRSVQAKERRKDSLQHLRDSFYDDVAAYIADLRAARDRRAAQVDDPFSDDDVRRMSDEIETAEEVAEALYERRVGKLVKLASFAAADMPVESEGLTSQERKLFDDLVDRIVENKTTVLDVLAGEKSPTTDSASSPDDAANPSNDAVNPSDALANAMGAADEHAGNERSETGATHGETSADGGRVTEPPTTETRRSTDAPTGTDAPTRSEPGEAADSESGDLDGSDGSATERTTVRITRDVGPILGVDEREYDLAREDVVTLPAANAEPLVDRDAAERIE
ncbi:hypothetical protein JCM18237_15100 [Halorubrum luteum]